MMKKIALYLTMINIVIFLQGCVGPNTIIPKGKWECENPKLYIEIGIGGGTALSGGVGGNENTGRLYSEDGAFIKICFGGIHGNFSIHEFREDGIYAMGEEIYKGEYEVKGDKLVL